MFDFHSSEFDGTRHLDFGLQSPLHLKNTLPAAYQPISTSRLPIAVARYLRRNNMQHYWQWADQDCHRPPVAESTKGRLVLFDGRRVFEPKRYNPILHRDSRWFLFRQPSSSSVPVVAGGLADISEKRSVSEAVASFKDSLSEAQPILLAIQSIQWDQPHYVIGSAKPKASVTLAHQSAYAGQSITLEVVANNAELQGKVYATLHGVISAEQSNVRFNVNTLNDDDLIRDHHQGLRLRARMSNGLSIKGDHLFSAAAEFTYQSELTLVQLADALKSIEAKYGYAQAQYAARQLDYKKLCERVHLAGKADNHPAKMPSRFALLPGVTDEALIAEGLLDTVYDGLHVKGPRQYSVALLRQCFTLMGKLPVDNELPRWIDDEALGPDEHGHQNRCPANVDLSDEAQSEPEPEASAWCDALTEAIQDYVAQSGRLSGQSQRKVKAKIGETFAQHCRRLGYGHWLDIWREQPEGLNAAGLSADVSVHWPELSLEPLKDALIELGEYPHHWLGQGFCFPAKPVVVQFNENASDSGAAPVQAWQCWLQAQDDTQWCSHHLYPDDSGLVWTLVPDTHALSVSVSDGFARTDQRVSIADTLTESIATEQSTESLVEWPYPEGVEVYEPSSQTPE